MEEDAPADYEDPLPSAIEETGMEVTDISRPRPSLGATRRLGDVATQQVERVQEAMGSRKERLVSQAVVAELGRSARRASMSRARTA